MVFGAQRVLPTRADAVRGARLVPQPGPVLDPKDPGHGVVDPGQGDGPVPDLVDRVPVELLPVRTGRDHDQVVPGEDHLGAVTGGAVVQLRVAVPVRHHDTVEPHPVLEHVLDQVTAAVDLVVVVPGTRQVVVLLVVPGIEGRHHHLRARVERRPVADRVEVDQVVLGVVVVAPVDPVERSPVTDPVLDGRHDPVVPETLPTLSLEPVDHRRRVGVDHRRVLRVALVDPPPPVVAGDRDGRRECPVQPGRGDLGRGHGPDPADQVRVTGRTEPDVVGEQGRTEHVVVSVDRVGRPRERDTEPTALVGPLAGPVVGIGGLGPVGRGRVLVVARERAAAVQDRAQPVLGDLVGRHLPEVGLDHLPDLLLERHPRQDICDERLTAGVVSDRGLDPWPVVGEGQSRDLGVGGVGHGGHSW